MQKDIKGAMTQYIDRTNLDEHGFKHYEMAYGELMCLREIMTNNFVEALSLAFRYGASKGYRCAMKNAKTN